MDFFKNRYFKISRISLLLTGQWPYEKLKLQVFLRYFFCLCGASFVNPQIFKLFTTELSLNLFLEVIFPVMICAMCYTKYFTAWCNADIIEMMLNRIKADWEALVVTEEIRIFEKYAEMGRIFGLIYMSFMFSGLTVFVSVSFLPAVMDMIYPLNEPRPHYHPFPVEYFVDQEKYFYPILIHMLLMAIVILGMTAASDSMFILILLHGCGLYNVLGYRLEHMFDDIVGDTRKSCNANEICVSFRRIANCVEYHTNTIKYVEAICSCYATASLIQLVLTIFVLASILLRLFENLSVLNDYGQIVVCILHGNGLVLLVFLYILPAQKLLDCSSDIFYSVYNARWYMAPLKVRRVMPFIMLKCMKPCGLTWAKYLTSSMELFAMMLQTSMSYFTVLYSVRQ